MLLSDLLGFQVADGQGRRARLGDLAVDLSGGDYPTVTRFILAGSGPHTRTAIAWSGQERLDGAGRRLVLDDLGGARPVADEELARAVLLERDVLDALVIDLEHCQATRANDLWLEARDGHLYLAGADLSPWAVLRRLGRGRLGRGPAQDLLDWKCVEFLRGDPGAARAGGDYHRRIATLPAAAVAHLANAVPYLHAAELLTLLPDPLAADALETMRPERQLQVVEALDEDQALRLLALVAPDAATDLVGRLAPSRAQRVLEALPPLQAERILDLLRYPEDTAGGIMTNDVVIAQAHLSAGEARVALREQLAGPDFVYYVYVVDDERAGRLRGVLTLRDLLLADDARPLAEVMTTSPAVVSPVQTALEAARQVADHGLAALPVVADDGRLLGAITVDAALGWIAPESWRDQAPRVFS